MIKRRTARTATRPGQRTTERSLNPASRAKPDTRRRGQRPRRGTGGKRSFPGWLPWLLITLAGLPLLFALKMCHKAEDDVDVKRQMIAIVHDFPDYAQNSAYYDQLVQRCHQAAFDSAYSLGGRHQAAELNASAYLRAISTDMASTAQTEGHTEVAATLRGFQLTIK